MLSKILVHIESVTIPASEDIIRIVHYEKL